MSRHLASMQVRCKSPSTALIAAVDAYDAALAVLHATPSDGLSDERIRAWERVSWAEDTVLEAACAWRATQDGAS